MAVDYVEMAGSPTFSYQNGEYSIHREVHIAWSDATAYSLELAPASTPTIQKLGAPFPGNTLFRVTGFNITPFQGEASNVTGNTNDVNDYEFALVTIDYGVTNADFLTHNLSSAGQFITRMPGSGLKWKDGSKTSANVSAGQFLPSTQHSLSWPRVLRPNWDALEGLKGTVNNAPFSLRGFAYPAETVLYMGYDCSQVVMADGTKPWSFGLKFSVQYINDGRVYDKYAYTSSPGVTGQMWAPGPIGESTGNRTGAAANFGTWNHFWRNTYPAFEANLSYYIQESVKYWFYGGDGVEAVSPTPGWYRLADTDNLEEIYASSNLNDLFLQGT